MAIPQPPTRSDCSALDSESERIVQDALDTVMQASHRTTIIIAHR